MTANRLCAVALTAAVAIACFAPPAIAASFDGNWSMLAVTTNGHCGKVKIGLGISKGRIHATSGRFAAHPIQLAGRISASGHAKMNAVAGPRKAEGIGRFNRAQGSGKWSGTGPSGVCTGVWTAVRAAHGS